MSIDPVSIAITAALTAANYAITALQHIEGPRLQDLKATVADYGTPLNYVYGRRRVNVPCFFAEPIEEVSSTSKGKGGKQTNYSSLLTFAIALADHEINQVRKIWWDKHLVYDATSGEAIFPLAEDFDIASHMRIYLGTEAQDPDPRMLAYIEARDGAGTCPAYKGVSYIFFEECPGEQIGNRFPQVEVEFVGLTKAMIAALA